MELKKDLRLIHVFSIATGAMISSGLFVLPGIAFARAGPAVALSYLLAGLLAATGLLSIAELSTAMPKAGGDYFFVSRGMGPAIGTVSGLLTWFALSLKSAFALVGMTVFARLVLPIDPHVVGIGLCAFFVVLNVVGIKEAARLQVGLVVGLLALMALYVVRGFPAVEISRFEPFARPGSGRSSRRPGSSSSRTAGCSRSRACPRKSRTPRESSRWEWSSRSSSRASSTPS